ncbi:hypothetical protein, partial [Yersinia ruckeri]|uniref:hypothetical protein n=1 Tax=Yersinia ruckeri TaxID=29486 RepID=UPI002238B094
RSQKTRFNLLTMNFCFATEYRDIVRNVGADPDNDLKLDLFSNSLFMLRLIKYWDIFKRKTFASVWVDGVNFKETIWVSLVVIF